MSEEGQPQRDGAGHHGDETDLGAGGPEELGGVLVHADRLDSRELPAQVVGDGAGLVLVVHIGVDDLPQRRGAVVESGLGGQPVVSDVLVYPL